LNRPFEQALARIDEAASWWPRIADVPAAKFDAQVLSDLREIESLAALCPERRPELIERYFSITEVVETSDIIRQARDKPLGYAGDFQMMDWMYTGYVGSQSPGQVLDEFFQRQAGAVAVRNRLGYFCDVFARMVAERGQLSVLDLACGPCRVPTEALRRVGADAKGTRLHCIDQDERAIAYAETVTRDAATLADFKWQGGSVFDVQPSRQYHLVMAGGLFDYLENLHAAALVRRIWSCLADGGKAVIGNFHPRNPTRLLVEYGCKWFMVHRTEGDLLSLCEEAEIPRAAVGFDQEPLGTIIFCIVTK
jgi:extracellular factor (EF) 3-hydroxypalmitic acid methyl ester biosynthesis protein